MHDDWSTNMKVRTSINLRPEQWRSAKDAAIHNFVIRFINGTHANGGYTFDEHVVHFICDCSGTETIASCLNFESVVDYILEIVDYEVKSIIRWSDGTSKQFKNVGNFGVEKHLAIKHGFHILHVFFPTCWGKGNIDLLGGIVHQLYAALVALLLERVSDLRLVVREMNSRYRIPGSTRSESSLSTRVFYYVSLAMNKLAKQKRTTWSTINFPSGVNNKF